MKKKLAAFIFIFFLISGLSSINAAEIKGQVNVSTTGKPYAHGSVLLEPLGTEYRFESKIDKQGNYAFQNIEPGRYILWLDLYSATPAGGERREIEIAEEDKTLELILSITPSMLDKALVFTKETSDFMWFPLMVVLLFLIGAMLTLLTRFIQVRRLILSLKMVLRGAMRKDKSEKEEGDISPYAALMTALAATVGNGNLAGVATAIATGGPGAPSGCGSSDLSVWPQNTRKAS